jgi:hypothetical protein
LSLEDWIIKIKEITGLFAFGEDPFFLKSFFKKFPSQDVNQQLGSLMAQKWNAEVWLMENLLPESGDEKKST